jgi:DNA-binding NarL/FixJ family response regulator
MLSPMGFHMSVGDRGDGLDNRLWRAALMNTLARSGEGFVVCSDELAVVFSTTKGARLLDRLDPSADAEIPQALRAIVRKHVEEGDSARPERLPLEDGRGAVYVRAARLREVSPPSIVVWLREEVLRDDRLYAVLREKYELSPRNFQLVQLVRRGLTNRQIGEHLGLAEATVKSYLHVLYRDCTALLALIEELSR